MAHTAPAVLFVFTLYTNWQRCDKRFGIDSQWCNYHFFYRHLSILYRKSRGEGSASLDILWRVSYRHWLGRNGVFCCSFSNCKLNIMAHWWRSIFFNTSTAPAFPFVFRFVFLKNVNIFMVVKTIGTLSREPWKRRPTRCRQARRVDSAGPVSPTYF